MRAALIALVLLGPCGAWAAEEPSGCDKFKWPIDRERAALTAPDRPKLASGVEIAAAAPTAMVLALRPPGDAALPSPPERAPKEGTFAGFASFKNPPKAGIYTFSGATDCDGIRKAMKYELAASPFVLQISGTKEDSISAAVLPSQ
jgi:hypothetical protein